jgi:hyperosmotically inducible protein
MRYQIMRAVSMLVGLAILFAPVIARAQAESTGEKIERKAKSAVYGAKRELSDSWLTARTKIALFADERVKGREVSVETRSRAVTLHGKVDSEEARAAAADVAGHVEGVRSVKNEIEVVSPAERKKVDVQDRDLAQSVKHMLSMDPHLKKGDIDVRVDAGIVTLQGEVPTIVASARASEVAREVPGVKAVKNELRFD